jgi:hypothetical protein
MGLSGPRKLTVKTIVRGKGGKNKLYGERLDFFVFCNDEQLASISIGDTVWHEIYNHEYGYLLEGHQIELLGITDER